MFAIFFSATTVKPPVKITTITTRKAVEKSSTKSASTLEVTKPTQQTTYDSTTTTSPNGSPPTPGNTFCFRRYPFFINQQMIDYG